VRLSTDKADGAQTEALACGSGSVNMIGICAAKSKQSVMVLLYGGGEIVFKFAPLVAAQLGIDQVFTLDV
jgi:hypothetical protein